LSEAEVVVAAIANDGDAVGAVLYRADGTALVVMRDAPGPGRSLQAWGVAAGAVTSLGAFEGRVLEVPTEGFEAVAISLEPLGGSATPTDVLGAAPRS
jgi:anti-sigma-K factor RskA